MWSKMRIFVVVLTILIFILAMSSCASLYSNSGNGYPVFPVQLHVSCLFLTSLVILVLTYLIFFKHNFECWFTNMGFLIYSLCELIILINVFTMEKKRVAMLALYIETGLILALLCIYTRCVSWHYQYCEKEKIKRHEEYVNRQISSTLTVGGRANCVRIPLKGDDFISRIDKTNPGASSSKSTTFAKPGTSRR